MNSLEAVREWVIEGGLLDGHALQVVALEGGVSCDVFAVTDGNDAIVVKHAGRQLRVASRWLADPRRVVHEGEVLETLALLTPHNVPQLLAIDRERHAIAMSHAPATWVPWKQQLMLGLTGGDVAADLGRILGSWHHTTWGDARFALLDDYELFESLRLDPYFAAAIAQQPSYSEVLDAVVGRIRSRRLCLVHGDFSPKNVLVGDGRTWVLDHEVAHIGDPQFDLAFMFTHLALKAINRPESQDDYQRCATDFLAAYAATAPGAGEVDGPELCRLVGALLVARVHGKSPVEYLDTAGRSRAVEVADQLLFGAVDELAGVWSSLERPSR